MNFEKEEPQFNTEDRQNPEDQDPSSERTPEEEFMVAKLKQYADRVQAEIKEKLQGWYERLSERKKKNVQAAFLVAAGVGSFLAAGCGQQGQEEGPQQETNVEAVEQGETADIGYELSQEGAEQFLTDNYEIQKNDDGGVTVATESGFPSAELSSDEYQDLIDYTTTKLVSMAQEVAGGADVSREQQLVEKRIDIMLHDAMNESAAAADIGMISIEGIGKVPYRLNEEGEPTMPVARTESEKIVTVSEDFYLNGGKLVEKDDQDDADDSQTHIEKYELGHGQMTLYKEVHSGTGEVLNTEESIPDTTHGQGFEDHQTQGHKFDEHF